MKVCLSLLFVLVIAEPGCRKGEQRVKIDSDILVHVQKNGDNILIKAETEKIYPCVNYYLMHSVRHHYTKTIIRFKKVREIDFCLTQTGPAACTIDLGNLKKGKHKIEFELNGSKNSATLLVDTSLVLTIENSVNVRTK